MLDTNAGQDAPPTMGVGPEHVPLRPMNRATTI
jgi:hypothetical protein